MQLTITTATCTSKTAGDCLFDLIVNCTVNIASMLDVIEFFLKMSEIYCLPLLVELQQLHIACVILMMDSTL